MPATWSVHSVCKADWQWEGNSQPLIWSHMLTLRLAIDVGSSLGWLLPRSAAKAKQAAHSTLNLRTWLTWMIPQSTACTMPAASSAGNKPICVTVDASQASTVLEVGMGLHCHSSVSPHTRMWTREDAPPLHLLCSEWSNFTNTCWVVHSPSSKITDCWNIFCQVRQSDFFTAISKDPTCTCIQ